MNKVTLLLLAAFLTLSTTAYAAKGHDDHGGHGGHDEERQESHGHGDESEHEDEHGGHDGHDEEAKTEIAPDAAKKSGIKTEKAGPENVRESITLTGRIILNQNTTVNVRGRFPGIVKSVHVNLGDEIKAGQVLARIESNESLQVYEVSAPSNGVVLERNTTLGDVVGDGVLFKIADLSNVWAEFHVFPKDLSKIREGQVVRVHTLQEDIIGEAPIKLLLPTADRLSQTVMAIITLDNANGQWRPGMTVEGDVTIAEKEAAVTVKEQALQSMEDSKVVFVRKGNVYEARAVEIGRADGKHVEILSGLVSGEEYVADGSFIVKADIGKAAAKHEH